MEMTFNQYVDTLCECIDTAIYNYNIEVMVEAADEAVEDPKKSSERFAKLKNIANGAVAAFKQIWRALLALIRKVKMTLLSFKRPFTLMDDVTLYEGAVKFDSKLCSMIDKALFTKNAADVYNMRSEIDNYKPVEKTIKKGTVITVNNLAALLGKYEAAITKFSDSMDKIVNDTLDIADGTEIISDKRNIVSAGSKILSEYMRQISVELLDKQAKKYAEVAGEEYAKNMKDAIDKKNSKKIKKYNSKNESIDIGALRASLLSEAARLLDEDAACYVNGIDGGDVLSNGLPSEKPVVDDEYPADDVTGGYGDGTDETPIEDLVDNDKDALDILKVDKGSVDPTVPVTESVVIRF